MKKIAIIFNQAPHGTAKGRETLDLVLALSDINQISVFFIGEGVLHLLSNQQPDKILMRDYITTFGMLELYDINDIYICSTSLAQYNLASQQLIIDAKAVTKQAIAHLLVTYDTILHP
ncbi:sulfurtransferase complex subunit TusC [Orbus sturtevantii]|uniref:sulfurtransferase complex subunit TusC n=1 Tax=Orbus sturtevantii TaxID=3074109 RepID=UPI00370D9FAA